MRIKGWEEQLPQPLTRTDIPERGRLHSPRKGDAHGTPRPIYPGETGFDDALAEVTMVREYLEHGEWPEEYLTKDHPVSGMGGDIPYLLMNVDGLSKENPDSAAQVVAMDRPSDLGNELFLSLWNDGVPLNKKYRAAKGNVSFVEGFAQFSAQLGVGIYLSLDKIFDVKYHWMLERPETVIDLPACIYTGDEYGAPNHPAYGAGHGAVSGITRELIRKFFELSRVRDDQVVDACYQFSHWRTLLGVHYRADNDIGIQVGASVIDNIRDIR